MRPYRLTVRELGVVNQNKPQSLTFFRVLAVAHGVVGLIPLLFSLFVGGLLAGGRWWLPSSGASGAWLGVIAVQLLLPMAAAAWLFVLAWRLWRPTPRLATPLRWTHAMVLPLGGLHCVWGLFAIQAAGRSAAAGGGLLGPAAVLPLAIGVPLVDLALASFAAARRIAGGP
jgi:hypothetical protein